MQSEYTTRKTLFKNKKITILLENKKTVTTCFFTNIGTSFNHLESSWVYKDKKIVLGPKIFLYQKAKLVC